MDNTTPKYAEWWQRLLNLFIDTAFASILFFCFLIMLVKLNINLVYTSGDWKIGTDSFFIQIENIPFLIFLLLYYIFSEGIFKTTLGKLLTRTKVVQYNGNNINFKIAVIRSVCRFIPLEQLSFLSKLPNGLHDSISSTKVIKISSRTTSATYFP